MANNTLIGALRAEATLDGGKFVDGAKKIRKEAKATEAQLKTSFSAMGAAVKGFGGAVSAGLSIGLLGAAAKKALDYAAAIKTTAAQVGISTKALQEFGYAASQVGVKQADADKALSNLNTTMGKALAGSKSAIAAFGAVGVSIDDIKTKSKTDIFGQIADQMIKQGGAAKNAAAANAIFGESAAKLTPLLDQGSQGINELSEAANRLGIVLSDQQIQQADVTAQKLEDVRRVLAAQIAGVVADNASSIVSLANALAQLTNAVIKFLSSNPQLALGIIGALAGGRIGGAYGAVAGGITGVALGGRIQSNSNDLDLRLRKYREARANRDRLRAAARGGGGSGNGKLGTSADATGLASAERVFQKEFKNLQRAVGVAQAAKVNRSAPVAPVDIPQFMAGGGGGRRRGRTPRAPKDTSLRDAYQFSEDIRRAEMDILRARRAVARSSEERAEIDTQILDAERRSYQAKLEYEVKSGEISQAQADQLIALYDQKDALERQAIADEQAAKKKEDAARLVDFAADLQREILEKEAGLAETAGDRRAAELKLLEYAYAEQRRRLSLIAANEDLEDAVRERARLELANLDRMQNLDRQAVINQTRGPFESWKAEFGDISDELENLKVQGIEGVADALVALSGGFENFRDVALNAIKQILAELIRLQIMKMLVGAFGGGPSAGAVSAAGNIGTSAIAGLGGAGLFSVIPGFASGGSLKIGGRSGIDRNLLQLNGVPVARVSMGERIDVSNDNGSGSGMPSFVFNNYAKMDAAEARRTGMQAAAAFKRHIGDAAKKGF